VGALGEALAHLVDDQFGGLRKRELGGWEGRAEMESSGRERGEEGRKFSTSALRRGGKAIAVWGSPT